MVKEECKEVSVSSNSLAKKESHFAIKTNIKETSSRRQLPLLNIKEKGKCLLPLKKDTC